MEVLLPEIGAEPVHLSAWLVHPGDAVFEGDRVVEVLVGGATFDVPSPATGRLVEQRVWGNDLLRTGQVLGVVAVGD